MGKEYRDETGGQDSMLSEINPDREKQILYDITYVWNLKKSIS